MMGVGYGRDVKMHSDLGMRIPPVALLTTVVDGFDVSLLRMSIM